MITASVQIGPLLKKLRQVPREAGRIVQQAIETDARGFIQDIIAITPPAMGKANAEAKKRGEAAVARDIRRVYITPGQLFDLIRAKDPRLAAAFWSAVKQQDWPRASSITRSAGVPDLIDFASDDGAAHQSRRRRGKVTGRQPSYGIRDPRYLAAYIKQQQARVGLLAAGFKPGAEKLRARLPAWVRRHASTIGTVHIQSDLSRFTITISNRARHGTANDLPRRMAYVLNSGKRKKRLINSLRYNIRAALKQSRLTVT